MATRRHGEVSMERIIETAALPLKTSVRRPPWGGSGWEVLVHGAVVSTTRTQAQARRHARFLRERAAAVSVGAMARALEG